MSESERHDISQEDPYFQHDELIGDVVLRGKPYSLRQLHERVAARNQDLTEEAAVEITFDRDRR